MAIRTVKLQDPQLDVVERVYYAKMGGSDITYNSYSAISSTNSQVIFSTTTPSVNVGLSRRMYWEGQISVVFDAAVPTANLPQIGAILRSNSVGCRQFPLANMCDVLSLKLNNSTMTINTADIIHALMRYGTSPDERNKYMSGSPSFPDELPTYNSGQVGGDNAGARFPFAAYTSNVEEISRQPFAWLESAVIEYATPPATDARVRSFIVRFYEPLFISPCNWSEKEVLALFGVQTIDITLSLGSSLKNRVFSGIFNAPAAGGANNGFDSALCSVSLLGDNAQSKPKLHVLYITPQINMPVPKLLYYPYYEVARFVTNGANLAPQKFLINCAPSVGSSALSQQINNISLHSICKRMYIYARVKRSAYDSAVGSKIPDIFARINKISMNWNNRAGMLSSATEYDLYRISVRNGCDQSWTEWTSYSGSVLCLEPSVDLGLSPLEAPGSRGNYQLQYQLDYTNLIVDDITIPGETANTYPYQVYTVVINEGFMTVNDSVISLDVGVLTEEAVKNADWAPPGSFNEITNLWGGGFWSDLWRGIKKGAQVARDVITPVSKVVGDVAGLIPHPAAQAVSGIAHAVNKVGKATGGRRKKEVEGGYLSGGILTGGRGISSRSLSRRL